MTAEEKLEKIRELLRSNLEPGHVLGETRALLREPTTQAPRPAGTAKLANYDPDTGFGIQAEFDAEEIEGFAAQLGGQIVWSGK